MCCLFKAPLLSVCKGQDIDKWCKTYFCLYRLKCELLLNKCLFNVCMFTFRMHAGGVFLMLDMLLVFMHKDDGRMSVVLSLSYDMHLENIHILNTVWALPSRLKLLHVQCID